MSADGGQGRDQRYITALIGEFDLETSLVIGKATKQLYLTGKMVLDSILPRRACSPHCLLPQRIFGNRVNDIIKDEQDVTLHERFRGDEPEAIVAGFTMSKVSPMGISSRGTCFLS